jgi:hypothetical protein
VDISIALPSFLGRQIATDFYKGSLLLSSLLFSSLLFSSLFAALSSSVFSVVR